MTTIIETEPKYESWFKIHKSLNQPYYSLGLRERFEIDGLKVSVGDDAPVEYADIEYDVDEEKFRARGAARLAKGGLPTDVPPFWPKHVDGPLCWNPEDIKEDDYVIYLTPEDKSEIAEALKYFKGKLIAKTYYRSYIHTADVHMQNRISRVQRSHERLFHFRIYSTSWN
jgi:hypothetical protein